MRYVGTMALALLLPALMLAQGCANKYERNHMSVERDLRERLVVAVMPFQGVSE